ncbi:glutaredoxin family protein [uncultured Gulosibacter sp.]|uniref:glutaredoxin family protein n=1 Tax=uncultured Gulosibacter sp. TaxID=1339167 RepID=UPI00288A9326|nr:glutaredoxin family protein [uncultured Gulosibacter sp.]
MTRIDFYERQGCHLCDDALAVVLTAAADAGAEVVRHDIDADPELQAQYGELVPVVEINGVQHAQWFVEAERLRAALHE